MARSAMHPGEHLANQLKELGMRTAERGRQLKDRQRFQVVYPVLPMDLHGVYVLLPE